MAVIMETMGVITKGGENKVQLRERVGDSFILTGLFLLGEGGVPGTRPMQQKKRCRVIKACFGSAIRSETRLIHLQISPILIGIFLLLLVEILYIYY